MSITAIKEYLNQTPAEDLRTAVQKGELTFLRLECSYGCVLDALCHSYTTA